MATTKWKKIKPVIDSLRNQFLKVYNSHREVSIDEAMVPFKGKSTIKQYMPKKERIQNMDEGRYT